MLLSVNACSSSTRGKLERSRVKFKERTKERKKRSDRKAAVETERRIIESKDTRGDRSWVGKKTETA